MMKTRLDGAIRVVAATVIALAAVAAPAAAVTAHPVPMAVGVNVDFLWNPDADNDTQVYLHLSNVAFNPPREQVRAVYPRLRNPESDFPVVVYLAREARVSLMAVWDLRAKGLPWAQVMVRLGVPPERIFIETRRDPGPPYGKAYGHWKNRTKEKIEIRDDDVFYWVNVRTMATYFVADPADVIAWRESGRTWKTVAGGEYRVKKGRSQKSVRSAGVAGGDDDVPPGQAKKDDRSSSKGRGKAPRH